MPPGHCAASMGLQGEYKLLDKLVKVISSSVARESMHLELVMPLSTRNSQVNLSNNVIDSG